MMNQRDPGPLLETLEPRLMLDGAPAPAPMEIGLLSPPDDTEGPVVVAHEPSGFVPRSDGRVEVVFNEPVNAATFTVEDVRVTIDALLLYVEVLGVEAVDDYTYLILFDDPQLTMDYHVWVGPEIEDLAGNPMREAYEAAYVVLGPPRVTDVWPAPETREELVSAAVAHFSQDMGPDSVTGKTFWIARHPGEDGEYGTNDDKIVDADVTYSPATRTASCVPFVERLWPGEYAVVLTDGMTDTFGRRLDGEWPGAGPGFPSGDGQEGGTFVSTFVVADDGRVEGVKWLDVDRDGQRSNDEPGLSDWTVYVDLDRDGRFDPPEAGFARTIDPTGTPGTPVVDPTGSSRLAESLAGGPVVAAEPWLHTPAPDSDADVGMVFGWLGPDVTGTDAVSSLWQEGRAVLHVDFTEPVATVSLSFLGTPIRGGHEGVLTAYGVDGELLEVQRTDILWGWATGELKISRGADEIAAIEATGSNQGAPLQLDRLQFEHLGGPGEPHAVTGDDGAYAIDDLEAGTYVVSEVPQAGWQQTFPRAGAQLIDETRRQISQTTGALDFGIAGVGPDPAGTTPYAVRVTAEVVWSHGSSHLRPELTAFRVDGDRIVIDLYGYNPDVVIPVVETEYHTVAVGALDPGRYEITATLHEQNAWLPAFVRTWVATGTMVVAEDGSHVVHLAPGQTVGGVDFGNYASGSIQGRKWHDLDGDGERDHGEPGLAGWTIYVDLNGNGQLDGEEPSTRTLPTDALADCDLTGVYVLRDVPPGKRIVAEVIPDGWRQTYPQAGVHEVTVPPAGTVWGVDFGNLSLDGRICGVKWLDMDQDGVRSHGEPGLAGWWIYVDADRDGQYDAPHAGWTWTVDPFGEPGPIEDPLGFAEFVEAVGGGEVVGTRPWLHAPSPHAWDLVFGWVRSDPSGVSRYESTWQAGEAVLRVDFDEPVSAVMLDFLGTPIRGGHQGILNAFSADGELLQSVRTEIIWGFGFEAVSIFRDANEIAYVEATGAADWAPIQMDRLQFAVTGSPGEPSAVTRDDGSYCIPDVPAGEHVVAEVPWPGWRQTYPAAFAELTAAHSWQVAGGGALDFRLEDVTLWDEASVPGAVCATFGVTWCDTSWSLISEYTDVRVVGSEVYVDLYARSRGIGLMVLWDQELDVPIHLPAGGKYTIHAKLLEEVGPLLPAFQTTWQAHGEMAYEPLAAHRVRVRPGEIVEGVDFGNYASGSIHGRKWHDLDGDGERDPGEEGLAGWVIYVDLNANGSLDNYEPHAVTMADDPYTDFDEAGLYSIGEVPPGWHRVAEIQHAGWVQTYPADGAHSVRVIPDASIPDVDFGNRDGTPPRVIDARRNARPGSATDLALLEVTFSEDVTVAPSALTLHNVTRGEAVVLGAIPPDYDAAARKATWNLTDVAAPYGDVLCATVGAAGVTDVVGLPMEADCELEFCLAVPGDATLDGKVDYFDYAQTRERFGMGPAATWADGDYDGNGLTDVADYLLMKKHYGTFFVPADAEASPPGAAPSEPTQIATGLAAAGAEAVTAAAAEALSRPGAPEAGESDTSPDALGVCRPFAPTARRPARRVDRARRRPAGPVWTRGSANDAAADLPVTVRLDLLALVGIVPQAL